MISYLKTFLTFPLAGSFWMLAFVVFVALVIMLVALFRKDVGAFSLAEIPGMFKDWKYWIAVSLQQLAMVTIYFWLCKFVSPSAALVTSALVFGVVGHFGNRALMGWCTAMGLAYLTMWSQFNNVYILIVGHYILAKIFSRFTPESFNEGMRVYRF